MTAAVAVMSATTAPTVPKRHGFSIESLIGTQETPAPSSPSLLSAPSKPTPVRPVLLRDATREEKHRERERGDHGISREREIRVRESREKEIERDLEKEKAIALEEMRERELREMRDRERTRDREMREIRDRDMREIRDSRDDRGSNPHFHRLSPHSTSPSSPRAEKSLTPESENRLTVWPDEEFKHLLANFHNNQLDSAGIYQPLRVCNRTLVSMGGVPGPTAPPNPLGVGMPPHFTHLPINPLLYNIPRDLAHQTHPLLTSRYPGFLHPRYPSKYIMFVSFCHSCIIVLATLYHSVIVVSFCHVYIIVSELYLSIIFVLLCPNYIIVMFVSFYCSCIILPCLYHFIN